MYISFANRVYSAALQFSLYQTDCVGFCDVEDAVEKHEMLGNCRIKGENAGSPFAVTRQFVDITM